jgi:signal transduction histidine kinase
MSDGIKIRLTAFTLAIAGMVALIAWTAHSSWRRTGELRERLTSVQLYSFQIAEHFQKTILELNNVIMRYGAYHEESDWARFQRTSKALDLWIDEQRPILSSEKEKALLDQINAAYDDYMAAGRQMAAKANSRGQTATPLMDFEGFEAQSQRILHLAFQLAVAHRQSMDSFLTASNKSLSYLRFLILASLALLLLAGGGLAAVVYRELLAPLRIKLVQSQALMERQEKLASLGMLAAGVAHEIRNPLTAIKAWLFMEQKQLRPGTPEFADAEIISNEINRLERIVKDVLLFARPSEPQFKVVPAEQPLRQVQQLFAPQLARTNIQLHLESGPIAQIRIDPQQFQQVLINLIQNAAESIEQSGVIALRVREGSRQLGQRLAEVVILEVADTGKGITSEVEKRLFDPFFTTKESGTGLGLSIAARIVEKHGGALQYQTQVNHGTVFGVVLPKVEAVPDSTFGSEPAYALGR